MRRIKLVLVVVAVMVAIMVIQCLASPGSNDGWSILCSLELGLVLVIKRAMVVLGVAQNVLGFYGVVDTMGWMGLGIVEESGVLRCPRRLPELPRIFGRAPRLLAQALG